MTPYSNIIRISGVILAIILFFSCKEDEKTDPPTLPEVTSESVVLSMDDGVYIALASGNVIDDGGLPILACGFCWSINHLPTVSDSQKDNGKKNGPFSCKIGIGALLHLTTYYFRAFATNSLGTSYGNEFSLTTPCVYSVFESMVMLMSKKPADGAVNQPTNQNLSWECTGGNNIRFDVFLGTKPETMTKIASEIEYKSLPLVGLDSSTTYYWRIYAWDSTRPCKSAESSGRFTTVLRVADPASVSTIYVKGYTYSTATVGGYVSSEGGTSVTDRGVYWGTSQNPESTGSKLQMGSGSGSFSGALSGLLQNTTYFVKAYAKNAGITSYGSEVSFNTGQTDAPTVKDIDGNVYHIVTIGKQDWMAENLRTTRYADGASIPLVNNAASWAGLDLNSKAYCWYDDNLANKDIYGALYTWKAAMKGAPGNGTTSVQGACPTGWHIPSVAEWSELETFLGGYSIAGGKLKESGIAHWLNPNIGATNESGFTALPGGCRWASGTFGGKFDNIFRTGFWWTSDLLLYPVDPNPPARIRQMLYNYSVLSNETSVTISCGISVRCIKDK